MTQLSCPSCRLRFTRAASAFLVACPECGAPAEQTPSAEHLIGFRLFHDGHDDALDALPIALAAALRPPTAALTEPARIGQAVEPEA